MESKQQRLSQKSNEEQQPEENSSPPNNQPRWTVLQKDLSQALESWSQITDDCVGKSSPDEVKREEFRKILRELSPQIKNLSE